MKKLKKQMVGATMLSIVLACILGLTVTSIMCCYVALHVAGDPFELVTWAGKLSKTSVYTLVCSFICIFALNTVTVLLYEVNKNLWDKVHECSNTDEGFTIVRLIPDVKKVVALFEKIGSKFSKA